MVGYLVAFDESFPSLDKAFSHYVVVLRGGVRVVIKYIRHVLVHIWDEHA